MPPTRAITTQAVGADTEVLSDAIDTKGWEGFTLEFNGGVNAATSGTATLVVKESATAAGTYTAVPGTTITFATGDDNLFKVGHVKCSALVAGRFVKISITGGTGGTFTCGASVIPDNPKNTVAFTPALFNPGTGDVVALAFDVK